MATGPRSRWNCCNVVLKACPIWSDPVTFGGGIIIEKLAAPFFALAPAAKHLLVSQADKIAASDVCELKFFFMLIQTTITYSSTTYRWIGLNKSLMSIKSLIIYNKSQHFLTILKIL